MSLRMKSRRWIAVSAAALAVAGGSGLALAQQGGTPPSSTGPATTAQNADQPEPGDVPDAAEAPDGPGQETSGDAAEKAEAAKLLPQAKVTQQRAAQKALAASPGAVVEAQLGEENGTVVWEFEVKAPDGSGHEVKVNATTGAVISAAADEVD